MSTESISSSLLENKFQQLIISESVETEAITGDDDNDWLVVKGRHPKERRVNEARSMLVS